MDNGSETEELRWEYRFLLRYGPIGLCGIGVGMLSYAMIANRPDAVLVTFIVIGMGCIIAGVILPRISGALEVGTAGVKAELLDLRTDPGAFVLIGKAARPAVSNEGGEPFITVDDVKEAVLQQGWETDVAAGSLYVVTPAGQVLQLPNGPAPDPASDELLATVRSLGVDVLSQRRRGR
jgi:NhaP-type Na+/H+ or K+/H+ antiporter